MLATIDGYRAGSVSIGKFARSLESVGRGSDFDVLVHKVEKFMLQPSRIAL